MDGFSDDLFQVFQDGIKPIVQLPKKRVRVESESDEEVEDEYKVKKEEFNGCTHECAYPVDYHQVEVPNQPPAKIYPFTLDSFQQCSIKCIEKNESVLVAAHTSAGKTAIAEYAIALALKNHQRVIYTSPIKALSNQKYREFNDEFKDVGLMTGDVTINESASCLVMTTEILRSMLYKGSEVVREMAWVIFDEIHYMRDKERGVVWEETIIMLPEAVKLVFLSATIPNAIEFAEWICKLKKQPCHVVYTEYRPTPLQHYIFPAGGEGLYLVVDETGKFNDKNFKKAIATLTDTQENYKINKKVGTSGSSEVVKIVQVIMERDMQPAIVFSFSKKDCEAHAKSLNKFDFTSEDEKNLIQQIFDNAIDTLAEEDKELSMIGNILPLLKKGIGIHHGGLLPIIKEVTEILFQEGLVKCLFSTETFSMGLNMPARTVVFTNVRKFDGDNFRWISGGEYIQMSGRAGRRGIDDKGICILMLDQKMEPDIAKGMVKGHMDPLNSSFHLSYNMLLNLIRIEDSQPEYMIRKSFHQFQNDRASPTIRKKRKELQEKLESIYIENEHELDEYSNIETAKQAIKQKMKTYMQQPEKLLRFITPGRLVYVVDPSGIHWGWGVVVNFTKKKVDKRKLKDVNEDVPVKIVVDVVLYVNMMDKPIPLNDVNAEGGEAHVIPMYLECIEDASTIRLYLPSDIKSKDGLRNVFASIREVFRRFNGEIPMLNPVEDMEINDPEFISCLDKIKELNSLEKGLAVVNSPQFTELKSKYEEKKKLKQAISLLNKQLKASKTMILKDDWKAMRRVLRRLGFISENHVELKGRVACEISTSDELLTTELMLSGVFRDLPVDVMVALLSCLVHEENSPETKIPAIPELASAYQLLTSTAKRFADVFVQSKLNIDQEAYVNSYKPSLMEAVYAWAHGSKFSEICTLTDTYEGTIIRCIRRLHELLRQLEDAAKSIQSHDLAQKFTEGTRLITRGIVFAASLYL
ncbi:unnamed protein product [Blepharisma stoltei]|uniref:Superkiller viralicidic activity 2-like 2 n=1 Tax=Blepharisma stoltei TaxID=1481888 RepID=A0AAU9JL33_9CILI|nr:unnamed protein product [Blepharisma stoltei]